MSKQPTPPVTIPGIGDLLAGMIRRKHGSVRAFCLATGRDTGTISKLLAGKHSPTIDTVEAIAADCGWRVTYDAEAIGFEPLAE